VLAQGEVPGVDAADALAREEPALAVPGRYPADQEIFGATRGGRDDGDAVDTPPKTIVGISLRVGRQRIELGPTVSLEHEPQPLGEHRAPRLRVSGQVEVRQSSFVFPAPGEVEIGVDCRTRGSRIDIVFA